MSWRITRDDCVTAMAEMPEASVDAVVCDPPYGLEFMGKDWDRPWAVGVSETGYTDGGKRLARPAHGDNRNPTCAACGGRARGARRCECPDPQWKPTGALRGKRPQVGEADGTPFRRNAGTPSWGAPNNPVCRNCGGTKYDRTRPTGCKCDAPRFPNESAVQMQMFQAWCEAWAAEALRVLKPGGFLLAFGGTRTYHRLACAVEDAGFEIRDRVLSLGSDDQGAAIHELGPELDWLYGSGFPKSLDVSKAIDKAAGAEREVVGEGPNTARPNPIRPGSAFSDDACVWGQGDPITLPAPDAATWQGWGTALKPAHEPIVVARKPLIGTVARNVLELGTGALNVDGCRIGWGAEGDRSATRRAAGYSEAAKKALGGVVAGESATAFSGAVAGADATAGRWPANVALTHAEGCRQTGMRQVKGITGGTGNHDGAVYGARSNQGQPVADYANADGMETVAAWSCEPSCPIRLLDEQTGTLAAGNHPAQRQGIGYTAASGMNSGTNGVRRATETGGASRFYYCAKASRSERNAGLEGFAEREDDAYVWATDGRGSPRAAPIKKANVHPTVKPIQLMRWLCRLVTPPGGTILDPFAGSGTTGIAAVLEGFDFVGLEREAEYAELAEARIAWWAEHPEGPKPAKSAPAPLF